jgi:hypothetical protein
VLADAVARSSESHSPPPPDSYQYQNGYYPKKTESLVKQTYSTTMTHPVTGKVKKFHVVAYSSKVSMHLLHVV